MKNDLLQRAIAIIENGDHADEHAAWLAEAHAATAPASGSNFIPEILLDAAYRGNPYAQRTIAELLGNVKVSAISDEQAKVIASLISRPAV